MWSKGHAIGVYPNHHTVCHLEEGDIEMTPVPSCVFDYSKTWDIAWVDQTWALVSQTGDHLYVARPDRLHVWELTPRSFEVSPEYIHLDYGPMTAHLPSSYRPSKVERDLDSWYTLDNPSDGHNAFSPHLHVWWSEGRMLAKHDPCPFTGDFYGTIWTSDDIDESFESVEISDDQHVLVNDRLYLNTRHPHIKRV
ncbi:MAG: hypothetical protein ABEN55_20770 [Bradymonadaceae bacterium]